MRDVIRCAVGVVIAAVIVMQLHVATVKAQVIGPQPPGRVIVFPARPGNPAAVADAVRHIFAAAAPGGPPSLSLDKATDLHLPKGKQVRVTPYPMNDSGGFTWDIYTHGGPRRGTNSTFSYGARLQVAGSNFSTPNSQAYVSQDGRELELGPYSRNSLQFYRRVRVYDDLPLARFVEIVENPGDAAKTVQLAVYTTINYGMNQIVTNSSSATFGDDDWAFVAINGANSPNIPHALFIPCGPKAKFRPRVTVQGNQVYLYYDLTVPPHSAVAVMHFMAQGRTQQGLMDQLKDFKAHKITRDLPRNLRALIANFRMGGFLDDMPEVPRSTAADVVALDNGDTLLGQVDVDEYVVKTFHGQLTIPARRVIGMLSRDQGQSNVLLVLSDGQIVHGELLATTIPFTHSTGSQLKIDVGRIAQMGYRISEDKPEQIALSDAILVFRTGERLALADAELGLKLNSLHGQVALPPESLMVVDFAVEGATHQVRFLNGSWVGGIISPDSLVAKLRLTDEPVEIDRQDLLRIVYAIETQEPEGLITVALGDDNGELIGRLTGEKLELMTDFGVVTFAPESLASLASDPSKPGRVRLKLWDGSLVRGELSSPTLAFALKPGGPTFQLDLAQPIAMSCPNPLPPAELVKEIEQLITKLGSSVFADRKAASEKLIAIGRPALPVLKDRLNDPDPEIRQRLKDIVEKIGQSEPGAASPAGLSTEELNRARLERLIRS